MSERLTVCIFQDLEADLVSAIEQHHDVRLVDTGLTRKGQLDSIG